MTPAGPAGPGPGDGASEGVGVAEGTGHPRVDAALSELDRLGGADVDGHAEVYDDVHRRLARVLADTTESAPGA